MYLMKVTLTALANTNHANKNLGYYGRRRQRVEKAKEGFKQIKESFESIQKSFSGLSEGLASVEEAFLDSMEDTCEPCVEPRVIACFPQYPMEQKVTYPVQVYSNECLRSR